MIHDHGEISNDPACKNSYQLLFLAILVRQVARSNEDYQKFKDELAEINNLSITADIWQSKRKHHYLCITGHWIDSNFNLQSKILSFRQFKGRHLAVRIRRNMCRTINNFNLKGKIVATTTDNGANVQAASSQMSLFGIRIHCFAHALNLVVQNSLLLWPKKNEKQNKLKIIIKKKRES